MSWADPYSSANPFSPNIGEKINFTTVYWKHLFNDYRYIYDISVFFYLGTASLTVHVVVLDMPKYEWDSTKGWVNYRFSRMSLMAGSIAASPLSYNVLQSISVMEQSLISDNGESVDSYNYVKPNQIKPQLQQVSTTIVWLWTQTFFSSHVCFTILQLI